MLEKARHIRHAMAVVLGVSAGVMAPADNAQAAEHTPAPYMDEVISPRSALVPVADLQQYRATPMTQEMAARVTDADLGRSSHAANTDDSSDYRRSDSHTLIAPTKEYTDGQTYAVSIGGGVTIPQGDLRLSGSGDLVVGEDTMVGITAEGTAKVKGSNTYQVGGVNVTHKIDMGNGDKVVAVAQGLGGRVGVTAPTGKDSVSMSYVGADVQYHFDQSKSTDGGFRMSRVGMDVQHITTGKATVVGAAQEVVPGLETQGVSAVPNTSATQVAGSITFSAPVGDSTMLDLTGRVGVELSKTDGLGSKTDGVGSLRAALRDIHDGSSLTATGEMVGGDPRWSVTANKPLATTELLGQDVKVNGELRVDDGKQQKTSGYIGLRATMSDGMERTGMRQSRGQASEQLLLAAGKAGLTPALERNIKAAGFNLDNPDNPLNTMPSTTSNTAAYMLDKIVRHNTAVAQIAQANGRGHYADNSALVAAIRSNNVDRSMLTPANKERYDKLMEQIHTEGNTQVADAGN